MTMFDIACLIKLLIAYYKQISKNKLIKQNVLIYNKLYIYDYIYDWLTLSFWKILTLSGSLLQSSVKHVCKSDRLKKSKFISQSTLCVSDVILYEKLFNSKDWQNWMYFICSWPWPLITLFIYESVSYMRFHFSCYAFSPTVLSHEIKNTKFIQSIHKDIGDKIINNFNLILNEF